MGESVRRGADWQTGSTSVRDRMDHLFNNPDMADIDIHVADEHWQWGETKKEYKGHKLVLCTSSPVFHQLFFPVDSGPHIPDCLTLQRAQTNDGSQRLDIQGIPPVAIEALLEYCYKDRFNRSEYENGYSRNLLWRLWHIAKLLHINHLFDLCSQALDLTLCDETVYWDLNYSLEYSAIGTEFLRNKVTRAMEAMGNSLYNHANFVFLNHEALRAMMSRRIPASSEAIIVFNNALRWALYQLDRTLCEEVDGRKDSEITVSERCRMINRVRQEKVKDFTAADINMHLDRVLDLVPYAELSQQEFLEHISKSEVLPQDMLLAASLAVMSEAARNPERLTKSAFLAANDPNIVRSALSQSMQGLSSPRNSHEDLSPSPRPQRNPELSIDMERHTSRAERATSRSRVRDSNTPRERSQSRPKADIKSTLEAARQRRLNLENSRMNKTFESDGDSDTNLLLVE